MSLKKQYLKTKPVCKVTFRLTREDVGDAASVHLTGEFNDWDKPGTPMKSFKNGAFTVTLDLEKDREYQFRYLVDKEIWINDPEADKYVASGFKGSDNAVICL